MKNQNRVPTAMTRGELENEVMQLRSWKASFESSKEDAPEPDFLSKWVEKKKRDLTRRAVVKEPLYMPDANRHKEFIDDLQFQVSELQAMLTALDAEVQNNAGKNMLTIARSAVRRLNQQLEEFFLDTDLKMPFQELVDSKPYQGGSI